MFKVRVSKVTCNFRTGRSLRVSQEAVFEWISLLL